MKKLILLLIILLVLSCSSFRTTIDSVSSATLNENLDIDYSVNKTSKVAIVLYSSLENNTQKIAYTMSKVLDADIISPGSVDNDLLSKYEVIGFGSGIFDQQHHPVIIKIAESLNETKKVFIISTSGVSREVVLKHDIEDPHDRLREVLLAKKCTILGEYNCPGYNRNSILYFIGGINRGRPNLEDMKDAEQFAESLLI